MAERVGVRPRKADLRAPVSCGDEASVSLSNYSGDAGHGSGTFAASDTWRAALLGTAAAGAMLLGYGRRAYADCAGPTPTLTCTGDLVGTGVSDGGIDVPVVPGVYTVLGVNGLYDPITPGDGTSGIRFNTSGDIQITSYADIHAKGNDASGIDARTSGAHSVTIMSTGSVTSDLSYGIQVHGETGDVYVKSMGNVTANRAGIYVYSDGAVEIHSTGDVSGSGGNSGIAVRGNTTGNVIIDSDGAVTGGGTPASLPKRLLDRSRSPAPET